MADGGFEGQQQAWLDAAEHVDEKWSRALERADRVRDGYRRLMAGAEGPIALGPATHDLLVKWLSALPLRERPRLVTTDLEFHALRRQLDRLNEAGLEVVKVAALPALSVGERIAAAVDDRTAAALVSAVFYRNAHVAGGLDRAYAACERVGARLLVDAYHALNVMPFDLAAWGIAGAAVTGGGYKYVQLGEGNAFLRLPPGDELEPVVTGWFAEFDALAASHRPDVVAWGSVESRFAGATYDPTSHYRASEVFDYFAECGLTVDVLAESYRHQVRLVAERFDALDLDPAVIDRDRSVPLDRVGGFLAFECPRAGEVRRELHRRGVYTDHRDTTLRVGPAPYVTDRQIQTGISTLGRGVTVPLKSTTENPMRLIDGLSRRHFLGSRGAGAVLPFTRPFVVVPARSFRIRAVTAGVPLARGDGLRELESALGFLKRARSDLESMGYEVRRSAPRPSRWRSISPTGRAEAPSRRSARWMPSPQPPTPP